MTHPLSGNIPSVPSRSSSFVTNVVRPSAFLQRFSNRRLVVAWLNQFNGDVVRTEKAHGNLLDRVVEWTGDEFIAKQILIDLQRFFDGCDSYAQMVEGKALQDSKLSSVPANVLIYTKRVSFEFRA